MMSSGANVTRGSASGKGRESLPKTAALWIAFRWQSGAQCISKGPRLADARMDQTNLFLDDTENILISVQDKVLLGVRVDMDGVTTVLR